MQLRSQHAREDRLPRGGAKLKARSVYPKPETEAHFFQSNPRDDKMSVILHRSSVQFAHVQHKHHHCSRTVSAHTNAG